MIPLPPRSTRTDTLFPYTTLFRSATNAHEPLWNAKFVAPGARQRQICRGASALLLVEPICELAFRHVQHPCRSEEHTSELQSLMRISYAVFCLKKKIKIKLQQYMSTIIILT